jgi:N-methylhydantoinase A
VSKSIRVGIDVGGTFTDVVAFGPDGDLILFKIPSTPHEPSSAPLAGLRKLSDLGFRASTLTQGTTLATNLVVQGQGARAALVMTEGFRDVLAIARQDREEIYSIDRVPRPSPLVPRELLFEIRERMSPEGKPLVELEEPEIESLVKRIADSGVEAVAICLLHSYANPEHERRIRDAVKKVVLFVCASSDINAEFREYERTSTTVLNAILMPIVSGYVESLQNELEREHIADRLHIVSSNGGSLTAAMAREKPLGLLMSGPAAGVAAAQTLASEYNLSNAITLDIGGTTSDVCFIKEGKAEIAHSRKIAGHAIRTASVSVESVGAGGGSIAYRDAAGALKVGPESAGAVPGPVCYGLGGERPTVTDAHLTLGYLNPRRILGGEIQLQPKLAKEAVGSLAKHFGYSLEKFAEGILTIAEANINRALRLVALRRGYNLEDCVLIAYGGMGPLHAGRIAKAYGFKRIIVPTTSSNFSALGCLGSGVRYESVRTHRTSLGTLDSERLIEYMAPLIEDTQGHLVKEGYRIEDIRLHPSLDCRYLGQNYELEVPLSDLRTFDPALVREAFHRIHHRVYAYSTEEPVECVNLRMAASLEEEGVVLPEVRGSGMSRPVDSRRAFFHETGETDLPVYDRGGLAPDQKMAGPLVVEDEWSTTLVLPGQRLWSDRRGNLFIEMKD